MIKSVRFQNFTAFEDLKLEFSPGINVLLGQNSTGKTHIMKVLYSACSVIDIRETSTLEQKLSSVFLPDSIGRLVRRSVGRNKGRFSITRQDQAGSRSSNIVCEVTTLNKCDVTDGTWRKDMRNPAVYIPVKDMLAIAPGFKSLYEHRELQWEEIYVDILNRAYLPATRGRKTPQQNKLLKILQRSIEGRVVVKDEQFYLSMPSDGTLGKGTLEFTLLAEGYCRLGLLYLLIQNESLTKGSILFWDEPEANLNPKLSKTVVEILMALAEMGVQIFVATHDYVFLKELEFAQSSSSTSKFYSLYRSDSGAVSAATFDDFSEVAPNSIDEAFDSLLAREINSRLDIEK